MIVEELIREIGAGPSGPGIAAVFDFDGTLIDGYSAAALYEHRFRNLELGPGELLRMLRASTGPTLTEEQFTGLVHDGIRGWVGRPESELLELGERLFAGGIAGSLFHEAWRLVEAHQRAGHTVLIATSATMLQVAPLARELGVEHVVCTRLATEDGRLTGRIDGAAPWGEGKIAEVREFFDAHDIDAAASHAYANGDEDVPLLAGVGWPHPVNPRPELAAEAARRGWPALRFHSGHTGRFDPAPALRTAALFGTLFASAGAGIALGALNRDRRLGVDIATAMFNALAGPLTDIRVEVVGARHAWSHRPAVFFINHQSTMIDFLVTTRVIRNAGEIMWRNARTARAGTVQAAVLPPISTDGWTATDIDAQVHAVRQLYLDTMADWPSR